MTTYYVNGVEKNISLRSWFDDGWNSGYSPDFFYDMETDFPAGSELTEEEYRQVVEFWADEVSRHNNGEETEIFGEYNGVEYLFEYDEI